MTAMSRIDLQVPFIERDEAKRLGARWDIERKTWYVPQDLNPAPFEKWLPLPLTPNLRAPRFFLSTAVRNCWRCAAPSPVVAIILPAESEEFYVAENPSDDYWQDAAGPVLLSYLEHINDLSAAQLAYRAPHYRLDHSHTTGHSYWMNHCKYCAAKLGDHDTIRAFGSAFSPGTKEQAARINLDEIHVPIVAVCGGLTYSEWLKDAIRLL